MGKNVKALAFGSVFLVIMTVFLAASGSFGSDNAGAWRIHERQAPTKEIKDIRLLSDGRLMAASSGSFHLYNGTRWKKYAYGSPLLSNHVPFFSDSKGRLYFNDDGLAVWENGKVTRFDSIQLVEPLSAAESGSGTVYLGSYFQNTGGVYAFDGVSAVRIYEGRARSLAIDDEGKLWASAIPSNGDAMRLLVYDNGSWNDRTAEIGPLLPITENSLTVQTAPDGAMWACNKGPYGVYRGGKWEFSGNVGTGVPIFLKFDHQGGAWGYSSGNLYRLDTEGKWKIKRTFKSVLPNTASFLAASDSAVYTFNAPDSVFVSTNSGNTWNPVPDPYDLGSDTVTCLEYLNDGTLLCGHGVKGVKWPNSDRRGLSYYDGRNWKNFSTYGNYTFPNVYVIKRSPVGLIYFYADSGFYTFDGNKVDSLDSLNTTNYDATDMAWDSTGELWFSTGGGIVKLSDPFTEIEFTPVMDLYPFVYNLCFDGKDNMYMQTWSSQVLMTDQVNWYQYISGTGRATNDIAVEESGKLWGARVSNLSWWDVTYQEWRKVADFPDSNRVVQIDPQGRIWTSSYGKTGYYSNDDETFHDIPELASIASNAMCFSADGRISMNSFNRVRTEYHGIEEFIPSTVGVKEPPAPVPFLVASAYPNPFNPRVTIQFTLPSAEAVTITVYNVAGQRVKQLADRRFPAGISRVEWDSRTDGGGMASSGVYFYRIEAGHQVKAGKMLLLR